MQGLNQFSDQSFADFANERLMNNMDTAKLAAAQAATPRGPARRSTRKLQQTPPATWDWRAQNKVPAARDQGGCGSCWAFAGEPQSAVCRCSTKVSKVRGSSEAWIRLELPGPAQTAPSQPSTPCSHRRAGDQGQDRRREPQPRQL